MDENCFRTASEMMKRFIFPEWKRDVPAERNPKAGSMTALYRYHTIRLSKTQYVNRKPLHGP